MKSISIPQLNPRSNLIPLIAVFVGLIFAVSYGFNYGMSNHNTYLLHGLRLFDPEILKHDWLASETSSYHPVFSFLVYVFYNLDSSGWIFAIANVAVTTAGAFFIYKIMNTLQPERVLALFAFVLVMAISIITRTNSVSDSYIFEFIFQASSIAALGLTIAIYFFIKGNYIASGAVVGLAGLTHANFLVLSFPLFFFAHIIFERKLNIVNMFKQFTIPTIALAIISPVILELMQDSMGAEGKYIFQHIVAPFHYVPNTFLAEFIPFLAWQSLGFSVGWMLLSKTEFGKRMKSLLLSLVFLVWIATALTTFIFIPTVSQLYFWRLAPFSDLFFQCLTALGIITALINRSPLFENRWTPVVAILSAAAIMVFYLSQTKIIFAIFALSGAILISRNLLPDLLNGYSRALILVGLVLLASLVIPMRKGLSRSSLIVGFPEAQSSLYQWANENTLPSAQFLVSPELYNFRFHAQRPIIVDKKSTPVLGSDLVEWHKRISAIVQIENVQDLEIAIEAYENLKADQLPAIYKAYPFDYFIHSSDFTSDKLKKVYSNAEYKVYRYLPDATTSE